MDIFFLHTFLSAITTSINNNLTFKNENKHSLVRYYQTKTNMCVLDTFLVFLVLLQLSLFSFHILFIWLDYYFNGSNEDYKGPPTIVDMWIRISAWIRICASVLSEVVLQDFSSVTRFFLPADSIVEFRAAAEAVPLPEPYLLSMHHALAEVLNASGMGETVDRYLRDLEELKCLGGR